MNSTPDTASIGESIDIATWLELVALYHGYASALDAREYDRWPEFFTDDCRYYIQPRDNREEILAEAMVATGDTGKRCARSETRCLQAGQREEDRRVAQALCRA